MKIEIRNNSKEVLAALNAAATRALETCGLVAEGHAKRLAPVDTGNLRNSITHKVDAMAEDEKLSGKKSVTKYGENANTEDFAESLAEYVKDPVSFKNDFPNRARIIEIFLR